MASSSRGAGLFLLALAIGCTTLTQKPLTGPAPEAAPLTEGPDATGRVIRLADHRGRVVLLSFWHSA